MFPDGTRDSIAETEDDSGLYKSLIILVSLALTLSAIGFASYFEAKRMNSMQLTGTKTETVTVRVNRQDVIDHLRRQLAVKCGLSTDHYVRVNERRWYCRDWHPHNGDPMDEPDRIASEAEVAAWRGLNELEVILSDD